MTTNTFPASYQQESLYMAAAGGASAVTVPLVLDVIGPLDLDRLHSCLAALVGRHEALRTHLDGSRPHVSQIISEPCGIGISQVDVDGVFDVTAAIQQELATPFLLEQPPLARASLIRQNPARHTLVLALHHAIADGWSAQILAGELAVLYSSSPSVLSPLTLQFGDYAAWERQPPAPSARDYWTRKLADATWRLTLPGHVAAESHLHCHPIDAQAVAFERVKQIAHGCRTTTTAVLAAAMLASIGDLAENDFTFALMRSNRHMAGVRNVVGPLADHMPVRVTRGPDPSFIDLLGHVTAAMTAGFDHGVPFGALRPLFSLRDAVGPWFDVSLNFITPPRRRPVHPDVGVLFRPVALTFTEVPAHRWWDVMTVLEFQLYVDDAGNVNGNLVADRNVVDTQTLTAIQAHFIGALSRGVSDPEQRLKPPPRRTQRERPATASDDLL